MHAFEDQLARLKEALGVEFDRDVAAYLDMKPPSLAERKRRNAFPTEKLFALAARRPELQLDVTYVLTGNTETGGHVRRTLEAAARQVGGDPDAHLAQVDAVRQAIMVQTQVTARRAGVYRRLLDCLEGLDDASVLAVLEIVQRMKPGLD